MKRLLLATAMSGAMAFAGTASAQSPFDLNEPPVGKLAGTFMVRARAIGVIPLNTDSSISVIGGHVSASAQAAPEVDFSYFFSDNIAVELIAATTRHDLAGENTAAGHVSVGSVWVLPPTITLQYHFMPRERFSPYVGAGLNVSFFYGAHHAGAPVTSLSVDNGVGAAIQAGFDYNISGHWFVNFDVKQIFLSTTANVGTALGSVKAKTDLNPLVVGLGIGYRF